MKKKFVVLASSCFMLHQASVAQLVFSNGATIQINSGAIVMSNGGMELSASSSLVNNGDLTVTKNSTFTSPGNFELNTSSVVGGNGSYKIEQDWINDATFNAGTSSVELFGNTQQFITSTTGVVTTFNHLLLTGTGVGTNRKKSLLGVNANTGPSGILTINDRELETQTNSFFVLNTSTAAVTNSTVAGSEGFVSSLSPGFFSRETNSASSYLFPTGSSLGTLRYRPIEITPSSTSANTYTVRMNNNDATADGFDRSINDGIPCNLNDLFYHSIQRSAGTSASDIRMFYIAGTDGTWAGMAHWRTSSTDWNDMSTMTLASAGIFSTVTRNAWNFTNPGDPYILTNTRPETPVISCPSICDSTSGNVFTLTGTSSSYFWTLPSNGTITSGQGTSSITTDWTTGTGYVYVYAVGPGGCNSLPDSCQPLVLPTPVADFTSNTSGDFQDTYSFTDASTGGSSWTWDFGDGGSSGLQNPTYQYAGAGVYTVILTVSNAAGCSDTAMMIVETSEGITIPNIFSPNGDGVNDDYYIMSGGLSEFKLSIFNRWGKLMFESNDINTRWDGKFNGTPCSEGTYYFILTAKSSTKDYSTTGNITLVNKKN